jgi:soluble cytochrome b562
MGALSDSFAKTTELLDAGKVKEAQAEFSSTFVPTVKKAYSEAAAVAPTRYTGLQTWPDWTKQMYVVSINANNALVRGQGAQATKLLAELRQHFYLLHQQTDTCKTNDFIFAFRMELQKDAPAVEELKKLCEAVEKAPASAKVKSQAQVFAAARAQWSARVKKVLADGVIDGAELQDLRQGTESLYRAFGVQLE